MIITVSQQVSILYFLLGVGMGQPKSLPFHPRTFHLTWCKKTRTRIGSPALQNIEPKWFQFWISHAHARRWQQLYRSCPWLTGWGVQRYRLLDPFPCAVYVWRFQMKVSQWSNDFSQGGYQYVLITNAILGLGILKHRFREMDVQAYHKTHKTIFFPKVYFQFSVISS